MSQELSEVDVDTAGWRVKLGLVMFILSIAVPAIGIPLVTTIGMSGTMVASVSGGLLMGAEVLGLLAIAVMGKPGYLQIKSRLGNWFERHGPSKEVSRTRYRFGLILLCLPLLLGWLSPYLVDIFPALHQHQFRLAIGGDVLFLISLFVLGGEFWAKVRALFVYDHRVVSGAEASSTT